MQEGKPCFKLKYILSEAEKPSTLYLSLAQLKIKSYVPVHYSDNYLTIQTQRV